MRISNAKISNSSSRQGNPQVAVDVKIQKKTAQHFNIISYMSNISSPKQRIYTKTLPFSLPSYQTSPTLISNIIYRLCDQVMFELLERDIEKNKGKPRFAPGNGSRLSTRDIGIS